MSALTDAVRRWQERQEELAALERQDALEALQMVSDAVIRAEHARLTALTGRS